MVKKQKEESLLLEELREDLVSKLGIRNDQANLIKVTSEEGFIPLKIPLSYQASVFDIINSFYQRNKFLTDEINLSHTTGHRFIIVTNTNKKNYIINITNQTDKDLYLIEAGPMMDKQKMSLIKLYIMGL